jgi:hypothetical protein
MEAKLREPTVRHDGPAYRKTTRNVRCGDVTPYMHLMFIKKYNPKEHEIRRLLQCTEANGREIKAMIASGARH